jgi:hypothetical protein
VRRRNAVSNQIVMMLLVVSAAAMAIARYV